MLGIDTYTAKEIIDITVIFLINGTFNNNNEAAADPLNFTSADVKSFFQTDLKSEQK
jgi:hypothetical protein